MALLDQLRLLDRALRDVRVREALRTGDRGGRRLARFAGSVAPADLAVLRAVDARRFEAVAQRQAEMIRDRWWTPRFPGVLAGAARALGATTRDVALGALASPYFDRREGEDETGVALLGFVLAREDRSEDPEWLADLIAYEYLVSVGLPRRLRKQKVDEGLEQRTLPEGTRFLVPASKRAGKEELVLARKLVVLPAEYPVSQLRDALRGGQEVPELEAEPHAVVFVIDAEGATELRTPALAHDLLDMLGQAPVASSGVLAAFDPQDRRAAHTALALLVEAGVVAGPLPPQPPEPEPSRKKGKNKPAAKPAAKKGEKKAPEPKHPAAASPEARKPEHPPAKKAEPAKKNEPAAKAEPAKKAEPRKDAAKKPAAKAAPRPAPKAPAKKPASAARKPAKKAGNRR